jgi:hypothetical protein
VEPEAPRITPARGPPLWIRGPFEARFGCDTQAHAVGVLILYAGRRAEVAVFGHAICKILLGVCRSLAWRCVLLTKGYAMCVILIFWRTTCGQVDK